MPTEKGQYAVKHFKSGAAFRTWMRREHCRCDGIWVRFFKKNSGKPSVNYAEALDVALCFGWIDGQVKTFDEESYLQKFTPRRARSMWSKRNAGHVDRLMKAGLMEEAGIAAVQAAKADGRWDAAYASPREMEMPADFLAALAKNKKAKAFFDGLNRTNRYAIAWRLSTAKKPETRERRMQAILKMMRNGERLH